MTLTPCTVFRDKLRFNSKVKRNDYMPPWSDDLFLVLALLSVFAFFVGIFRFVFRSGKRKAGAKLSGLSVIVFFLAILAFGFVNEAILARSGFETQAVYDEAASFGIFDAEKWEQRKDAVREERRLEEESIAREREAQLAAEQAKEAEERRKGFHCLSGWDGSHAAFKRQVKSMMRNPSSFEHISTRVTPVSDAGTHTVIMEYRAENGFGGITVGSALGEYSSTNCDDFTVLTVN